MGLFGDIKSRVILEYKADTEQAKIALRDLTGAQKKQAQAAVQGVEDQIKAHERLASKITLGIGIAAGAIAVGIQGFKKYEESTRLASATVGLSIERLRAASRGLLTDLELMQVAAAGANGKWHLTTAELENVLGAARALELRGVAPLSESVEKLTESIRKGEIDALKDLGVAYDENLAKTDKRAAAMKALSELAEESARATTTETEAIREHGKAFENATDKIQVAIGRLVVSMAPLIEQVARLVSGVADLADNISRIPGVGKLADAAGTAFDVGSYVLNPFKSTAAILGGIQQGFSNEDDSGAFGLVESAASHARFLGQGGDVVGGANPLLAQLEEAGRAAVKSWKARRARTPRGRVGGGGFELSAAEAVGMINFVLGPGEATDRLIESMLADRAGGLDFGDLGTEASDALAASAPTRRGRRPSFGEKWSIEQAIKPIGPSIVERMFGPKTEIEGYKDAWSGLTDTMLAGYDAIVTGSESVGLAMKKALGGAIHAVGRKMFIRSLEETAEGVASLIFNPAAAGQHFAAAGLFAAGSLAAGAAASALGVGGGVGGAGRGAGASASGVGLGRGGGPVAPVNKTYIIGDSFGFMSPRDQARQFAGAQRRTRLYERDPEGVSYS